MVTAVGASTSYSPATAGGVTPGAKRGLEAQVDTLKKQLCDWVTCPSAKTPEGKAKIEDLTNKLNSTEARIKQIDKTQIDRTQTSRAANSGSITANEQAAAALDASPAPQDIQATRSVEALEKAGSTGAGPGSLVDVFV
ncbi:MAG: hypothetical protein JWL63_1975 [Rhodocyclales bacterium]|nr:hypothetical protein [Rhodocyclales bacterium]